MPAVTAVCARAFAVLVPPPRLQLSAWIEREIVLPEGTSALPGRVRLWPYQREIADAWAVLAEIGGGCPTTQPRYLNHRTSLARLRAVKRRANLRACKAHAGRQIARCGLGPPSV